jgi:hypothetical protein
MLCIFNKIQWENYVQSCPTSAIFSTYFAQRVECQVKKTKRNKEMLIIYVIPNQKITAPWNLTYSRSFGSKIHNELYGKDNLMYQTTILSTHLCVVEHLMVFMFSSATTIHSKVEEIKLRKTNQLHRAESFLRS